MKPTFQLSFDPTIDAYTVVVTATVDTEEAFDAWSREIRATFAHLRGKKIDLLVDITALHLEPAMALKYGQFMRTFAEESARFVIRYGASDAATKSRVRLSAIANRYAGNVCDSRDEAVAALQKLRSAAK